MRVDSKAGTVAVLAGVLAAAGSGGCSLVVDGEPSGDAMEVDTGALADATLWFRFDSDPAAGIVDSSGHGRDGWCDPGRCPALGSRGADDGAYYFDGVDDSLRVANLDAELDTPDEFTVAIWARPETATAPIHQAIAAKAFGINGVNTWWVGFYAGSLTVYWNGGNLDLPINTDAGNWRHVAVVWDGAEFSILVDGLLALGGDGSSVYDGNDVTIGADNELGEMESHFQGWLDDFRLYDRALSVPEVRALSRR